MEHQVIKGINIYSIFKDMRKVRLFVPTNGYVKSNGEAVCGNKVLTMFSSSFPLFASILGKKIRANGVTVQAVLNIHPSDNPFEDVGTILSFPTRPTRIEAGPDNCFIKNSRYKAGDEAPGWMAYPNKEVIEKSFKALLRYEDTDDLQMILIDPLWDEAYIAPSNQEYAQELQASHEAYFKPYYKLAAKKGILIVRGV